MSLKQAIVIAVALVISYAGGVVMGKTEAERFELEGNMKFFGVGSGIIFTDGTKQTSAGVGSSNDVTCASTCVGFGEIATSAVGTNEIINRSILSEDLALNSVTSLEIALGAVGSTEVADGSLTAFDLATNSVDSLEIQAEAVGSSEIAPSAVGTSEVLDNSLTDDDLASSSVGASEIAADAVGAGEIAAGAVGSSEIASGAVGSSEVASKSITLDDLAMTVHMGDTIDLFNTVINGGDCSGFVATQADGVSANAFAHVFNVKLANGAATSWTIEPEDNPSGAANTIKIRICNNTGGALEAPNLRFSFWAIGQ